MEDRIKQLLRKWVFKPLPDDFPLWLHESALAVSAQAPNKSPWDVYGIGKPPYQANQTSVQQELIEIRRIIRDEEVSWYREWDEMLAWPNGRIQEIKREIAWKTGLFSDPILQKYADEHHYEALVEAVTGMSMGKYAALSEEVVKNIKGVKFGVVVVDYESSTKKLLMDPSSAWRSYSSLFALWAEIIQALLEEDKPIFQNTGDGFLMAWNKPNYNFEHRVFSGPVLMGALAYAAACGVKIQIRAGVSFGEAGILNLIDFSIPYVVSPAFWVAGKLSKEQPPNGCFGHMTNFIKIQD
jgi:hypothetical protein